MTGTVFLAVWGSAEFGPEEMEVFTDKQRAEEWLREEHEPHPPWKYTDVVPKEVNPWP